MSVDIIDSTGNYYGTAPHYAGVLELSKSVFYVTNVILFISPTCFNMPTSVCFCKYLTPKARPWQIYFPSGMKCMLRVYIHMAIKLYTLFIRCHEEVRAPHCIHTLT